MVLLSPDWNPTPTTPSGGPSARRRRCRRVTSWTRCGRLGLRSLVRRRTFGETPRESYGDTTMNRVNLGSGAVAFELEKADRVASFEPRELAARGWTPKAIENYLRYRQRS